MMSDLLNSPSILSNFVLPKKSNCFDFLPFGFLNFSFNGIITAATNRVFGLGGGVCLSTVFCIGFGLNFAAALNFGLTGSGVGLLNFCTSACFMACGCLVEIIGDIFTANLGDVLALNLGITLDDCNAPIDNPFFWDVLTL